MFAEIIIDIAHANVDRLFTYRVPEGLEIAPGQHVLVPFGHGNAQQEGFVLSVAENVSVDYPLKDVLRAIEPYPVLLPDQIALARWMQKNSPTCSTVNTGLSAPMTRA